MEQYSLIVMDTFKGQHKAEIKALGFKNDCELIIVEVNMTNKFQTLIFLSIKVISHKFNTWYTDCVSEQLKKV